MNKRRHSRQVAVQFLYQHDLRPDADIKAALNTFWELHEKSDPAIREYAAQLIRGVLEHQTELDKLIVGYAQNWKLERIAPVDRNILRMALYEMRNRDDVPPVTAIDEAIETAKTLSTEKSGAFINGILNQAKKDFENG